ncbi:Type I polyketide synthase OS=Streptomyces rimosus subsp. rimosus (strain ATCC / DSM 40260 / JCM 4667 / NRRL 2234) OX=1265868 GN=SRIM_038775 PE=4 SV=1 [Streptomyces rimosus subsp. rimosus]
MPVVSNVTGELADPRPAAHARLLGPTSARRSASPTASAPCAAGRDRFFLELRPATAVLHRRHGAATAAGEEAAVSSTPCARTAPRDDRLLTALAAAARHGAPAPTGPPSSRTPAPAASPCPPTPSSANTCGRSPNGPGPGPKRIPADAEFWTAVEQEDVDALASSLRLDQAALAPVLPALSHWRKHRRDLSTVDSWRYHATWKPLTSLPTATLTGSWLVVAPEGTDTDGLTAVLRRPRRRAAHPRPGRCLRRPRGLAERLPASAI